MERRDVLAAIRSALVGVGVSLAILVVGALIALKLANPDAFLTAFAYIALVAGAAVCGLLSGRDGAPIGGILLSAAIYALLPLTLSLILGGFDGFFIRALIYLSMGAVAGVIAWLIPQKQRRRRYRY
ncbi:MAG: hypothetical protein IJX76_10790 [Clostridia bacterium]|nr:hypothetical protein [Clostridia bacterium]